MKQNNEGLKKIDLRAGLKAGGAPIMWERILNEALPPIRKLVPPGSHVMEVGYGDGLLSCYLCKELGWSITGLDICPNLHSTAFNNSTLFGLEDRAKFYCCSPDETMQHVGNYDAVFIKTVLYNSTNIKEYEQWLDWILGILKLGGVLINFETGLGNRFLQFYRRLRRREYRDSLLYTPVIETLHNTRFEIIQRRYYGGWSQFMAPIPTLYWFAVWIEEALNKRNAKNCFAVSIISRKRNV